MKTIATLILCLLLVSTGFTQDTFIDFGIFETSADNYAIRAKAEGNSLANAPFNITSNFQITVRWLSSLPVSIINELSPAGVTVSKTSIASSATGSTAGFSYISFNYGPANIQIPIMNGEEVDLVTFTNDAGGGIVMELMDNGDPPTDIALNLGQTYAALASPVDNYRLNYQASTISSLPIELTSFEATSFRETNAYLDWTTSTEINSSHFEVERSLNIEDWTYVDMIEASGYSTDNISYNFIDENVYRPGTGKKVIYYRLRQVDLDGAFEYSDIRSVTYDSEGVGFVFSVYPNPTSRFVNIQKPEKADFTDQELAYRLFSSHGILVREGLLLDMTTKVSLDNLTSGYYFVDIVDELGSKLFTEKIVVVRD